jgi:ParB family chromosome partitioning protein
MATAKREKTKNRTKKPAKRTREEGTEAAVAEQSANIPSTEKRESTVLSIADIIDPPAALIARKTEGDTSALEADIKSRGQLQSLLVRPSAKSPGKYELLSGHRRRKALRKLGIEVAHVIIARDLPDEAHALAAVFAENSEDNRCNLTAREQAKIFQTMIAEFSDTESDPVRKVATRLKVSTEHIRRHMQILKAPTPVLDRLERGEIAKDTVIALQQTSDDSIRKVLTNRVVKGDITTAAELKRAATDIASDRADRGESARKRKTKSGRDDKRTVAAASKGWLRKSEMTALADDLLTQYAAFTGEITLDGVDRDKNSATIRRHQIALLFVIFGWIDKPDVEAPRFLKRLAAELKRVVEPHNAEEEAEEEESEE